ncbi:MAG: cupin domain-containing protein, partial [Chloroflexi bacterium]|nr:cupin domain-containing protein [Chloroflexota bacterium]
MTTTPDRYELWNLTPFEQWLKEEEVHIITDQLIRDVYSVETEPWERTGCSAAILDLTQEPAEGALINTQGVTRYIYDIPPGGKFNAERHMYEEIFFVLKGRGATTVWVDDDGPKHTFEWKEGSVFSIPLNAWHEIYNGQG